MAVFQEGIYTLTRCDVCRMHMKEGRLIRHTKTARCDKDTHMRWRRKDTAIAVMFMEAKFSLTGEEETEHIEGVEVFKHLEQMLDRSDNDWTEVLHIIRKARQVWGRLGKLLWREGAEPAGLAKFISQ